MCLRHGALTCQKYLANAGDCIRTTDFCGHVLSSTFCCAVAVWLKNINQSRKGKEKASNCCFSNFSKRAKMFYAFMRSHKCSQQKLHVAHSTPCQELVRGYSALMFVVAGDWTCWIFPWPSASLCTSLQFFGAQLTDRHFSEIAEGWMYRQGGCAIAWACWWAGFLLTWRQTYSKAKLLLDPDSACESCQLQSELGARADGWEWELGLRWTASES